jgi:hypothetical protein
MLADNLIEPSQLLGIEDLPDPAAVVFPKSAELLVHLSFEHTMLLVVLVHDAFKLADLRGREVEVVRQRFDHALPVETGTPIAGPQGIKKEAAGTHHDAQHKGHYEINVSAAGHF